MRRSALGRGAVGRWCTITALQPAAYARAVAAVDITEPALEIGFLAGHYAVTDDEREGHQHQQEPEIVERDGQAGQAQKRGEVDGVAREAVRSAPDDGGGRQVGGNVRTGPGDRHDGPGEQPQREDKNHRAKPACRQLGQQERQGDGGGPDRVRQCGRRHAALPQHKEETALCVRSCSLRSLPSCRYQVLGRKACPWTDREWHGCPARSGLPATANTPCTTSAPAAASKLALQRREKSDKPPRTAFQKAKLSYAKLTGEMNRVL